ncbi:MAG TPA: putative motility protein [Polyangiaceae bacterium]|nr:putative motility protein [Polyangiaceae bacterium]
MGGDSNRIWETDSKKEFKVRHATPFSGGEMGSNGISASSALTAAQMRAEFDVKVARKALDNVEQQGQNALKLIDAASAPSNVANGVGQRLNVVA